MPTYDYQCTACSHRFEQFQSMKDAPLKKCPKCGKAKLERLIGTGAAIIFKGSGFYQTDYRSDAYEKSKKADTEQSTSSSTETKSTDKPAKTESPATNPAPAKAEPSIPAPAPTAKPEKPSKPSSGEGKTKKKGG